MKNVVIIHFHPLELYPPIQNLIRFLEKDTSDIKICIYTNQWSSEKTTNFVTQNTNIEIVRLAKAGKGLGAVSKYWNYIKFYTSCIFLLIIKKPPTILYFETISSYPAIFYNKYINPSLKLIIHYHEYTSPDEYKREMILTSYFHKLEKKIIPKTSWLSHTNPYRMEMFKKDILPVIIPHPVILPNYPPLSWRRVKPDNQVEVIKCVYAGAVDLNNMYMTEFAKWVISKNGKVIWDLYSLMITEEAHLYFSNHPSPWIKLYPGIHYEDLPNVLNKYDVGLVLYKGYTPNHVYSVPNKVFEYLAVGLDVWLQESLIASLEYVTSGTYPKLIAVDFERFEKFDLEAAIDKNGFIAEIKPFFAENVLPVLQKELLER